MGAAASLVDGLPYPLRPFSVLRTMICTLAPRLISVTSMAFGQRSGHNTMLPTFHGQPAPPTQPGLPDAQYI